MTGDLPYLGLDGEGQGKAVHRYVLLAAATRTKDKAWTVHDPNGLSSERCLDFIIQLPPAKLFGFALNYDWTMILRDVDNDVLYELFRPENRQREGKAAAMGPRAVTWRNYRLNMQGTKFTISQGKTRKIIWDVFKFFQSAFVPAIKDWKVGDKELWTRMQHMKEQRAEFDKQNMKDVRDYCIEECACMAELAYRLTVAHEAVGLKLKSYYGAGSSASAMLDKMGIRRRVQPTPEKMKVATSIAFFGGRFENSVIGTVKGTIYNYDISSAYPYQLCFLPCLQHGRWEKTRKLSAVEKSRTALVRYRLQGISGDNDPWGPFPFRTRDGSICYPVESGGGWVWKDEFLAGRNLFAGVEFREAWIYHQACHCEPFRDIPNYYKERVRIGKEGPGIVLKLGMNSCYGKLAQSIGRGKYNNWIWAGLITSGTRAQLLTMMSQAESLSAILMCATDGIQSTERLKLLRPRETGTWDTGKPLGGWEEKINTKGAFYARPGIYFPLHPSVDELKDVRGRGVGKKVVLDQWKLIKDAYERQGLRSDLRIAKVSRFCGAKASISKSTEGVYTRAFRGDDPSAPSYGQWIERTVDMSFDPMPKRSDVNPDGTLNTRSFPMSMTSVPYRKARIGKEAEALMTKASLLDEADSEYS